MHVLTRGLMFTLASCSAPAAAATTITGEATHISVRTGDPGLVVAGTTLPFGPLSLDLDPATLGVSSSAIANIFSIKSLETYVHLFEDTKPYAISVALGFSAPSGALGAPITGSTRGIFELFGNGFGRVTWDGPQTYTFGHGGSFSIALNNTNFAISGAETAIAGRITLLSESSSAVPEPATWAMMLLGFGAVGYSMRRRPKLNVARRGP